MVRGSVLTTSTAYGEDALDLVGERWPLLIVRELLEDDQLRYTLDLHSRLSARGMIFLAARLKTLEQGGVVRRRQLDPSAASGS